MKKGTHVLLLTLAFGLCIVSGIFLGRTHSKNFHTLSGNHATKLEETTQKDTDVALDINTASKAQLMDLPGIGEELANRIIQYRSNNGPFDSVDELLNIEGIGEKKLLAIEARIKVGG